MTNPEQTPPPVGEEIHLPGPSLLPILAATTPEHFHDETSRTLREHLVDGTHPIDDALALLAELDELAVREGIDEPTAKELLLRLQEREVWAELQHADIDRTKELREALERIQDAIASLSITATAPD